ncbi:MAG: hypothetical protein R2848_00630 [Thermomicrobiales bacterium]
MIPETDPYADAKHVARRGLLYTVATFFAIFAALPFAWMVFTIFKTNQDLYNGQNNPFLYNDPPTLDNVRLLIEDTNYTTFLWNTVLVAIGVVIITVLIAVPAAYALTRLVGGWGEGLGIGIFLVYLIPPIAFHPDDPRGRRARPEELDVVDGGHLPDLHHPFCTWLMMASSNRFPGTSKNRWTGIAASEPSGAPSSLSVPGILTVIVFSIALTLHEFVYALAFVTSSDQKTVSIGVTTELVRGDVFFWQSLMAAAAIVAIPVALLYTVFLDRFVAGFTLGAVKG